MESKSQGLFKNGVSLEPKICFLVLPLKTKNSKITKFPADSGTSRVMLKILIVLGIDILQCFIGVDGGVDGGG